MTPKNIYTIVAIVLVLAGGIAFFRVNSLNNQKEETNSAVNTEETAQSKPAPTGCEAGKDKMEKDANGRFVPTVDIANKVVTLDTSMGKIKIAFYDKDAPKTVQNFICLSEKGYYNNVIFHRVVKGFVDQAGDPTGTGMGGESIYGGKFEDEIYSNSPSVKIGYTRGTVAMANAGPNTNGSQFFILVKDSNDVLPPAYTIFGKVIEGMDVVDKINAVKITPRDPEFPNDGTPVQRITIKSATVETVAK